MRSMVDLTILSARLPELPLHTFSFVVPNHVIVVERYYMLLLRYLSRLSVCR
jgi:hypothetical protein